MIICAVDPGNAKSAYVLYDTLAQKPLARAKVENEALADFINSGYDLGKYETLVIEYPQPRGQPMYYQLVDTIFWIGRFVEAFGGADYVLVDRRRVKEHMCGAGAKDANLRMACINRFSGVEPIGGGKCPEIGNKKQRGPLHGFAQDMWQALALAITYAEGGHKKTAFKVKAVKQFDDLVF